METVTKMNDNGKYDTINGDVGGSVTVLRAVSSLLSQVLLPVWRMQHRKRFISECFQSLL